MSKENANNSIDVADEDQPETTQTPSELSANTTADPDGETFVVNSETQLVHRRPVNSDSNINNDAIKVPHDDLQPATLDVGDLQTITLGHVNKIDVLKDENGLGKGVVLNATQLYPVRWVSDGLHKDKTKDHELEQNYSVSGNHVFEASIDKRELEQPSETKGGKMSLMRKILFGISFLPSILFVLLFAVILPCKELQSTSLCEKILWSAVFNDTDLSTDFSLSSQALLISSSKKTDKILGLDLKTGNELWSTIIKSPVTQFECHEFDTNGDNIYDCLVMTKDGYLYAYNSSNGYIFWNYTLPGDRLSNFAMLSNCDNNNIPEIAVAISTSRSVSIQIISNGRTRRSFALPECKTVPRSLKPWVYGKQSSLIYICETDSGHESLTYMKQDTWCSKEKVLKVMTYELLNSFRDNIDLGQVLLKPTEDGLLVWANDFLAFFGNNGKELWQIFALNHTMNRYMFYGNFSSVGKQVALVSGQHTSSSLLTLIDASTGNETFSHIFKEAIIENAIMLSGKEKDSILILLKEIQKSQQNVSSVEAPFNINRRTTVMDIELLNLPEEVEPKHKLVLLQFHSRDLTISLQEKYIRLDVIPHKEESTSLAAHIDEKDLRIYLGQTQISDTGNASSIIQVFQVNDWDQTELPLCK